MPRLSEERAKVVAVQEGRATVEMDQSECCGRCGLCLHAADGKMRLELDAVDGVEPGQTVVIAMDRSVPLVGTLLLFGLPLAGLVAGALIGYRWPVGGLSADSSAVVGALVLFAVGFAAGLLAGRRYARSLPEPYILRIESE